MNVNLQKTFNFQCGLVYRDKFYINNYQSTIDIVTHSVIPAENNIAYERIKYWVLEAVHGAILVSRSCEQLKTWQETGARIMVFPEEPVDQLVGIMLCSKLNSICQDRFMIPVVSISSEQGDNMVYLHEYDDPAGSMEEKNWWNDPRPTWTDPNIRKRGKVISLEKGIEWSDLDLAWDDDEPQVNTVVVANFTKDEN